MKPYLEHKHELPIEKQKELEAKMEYYFCCTFECMSYDGKVISSGKGVHTRTQIANILGVNFRITISESKPIGFNYDIEGNLLR